jgi:hypothetical protein
MEPAEQAQPIIIYNFDQVCIEGKREVIHFDYSKVVEVVDSIMEKCKEDLTKAEENTLRANLEDLVKGEVQARDQANKRMNKAPEECVHVTKQHKLYAGAQYPSMKQQSIHELQCGDDWKPRVALFQLAFADRCIFALSIVPLDPETHQTWYAKKSLTRLTVGASEAEDQRIRKIFFYLPDHSPFEGELTKTQYSTSTMKANQDEPSEVCRGFFKPYPTFSSNSAAPEFDPENLPPHVVKANVFSQNEINNSLSKIENDDLRDRVNGFVLTFIVDFQAKGMGLTILQAPRGLTLYFSKELAL